MSPVDFAGLPFDHRQEVTALYVRLREDFEANHHIVLRQDLAYLQDLALCEGRPAVWQKLQQLHPRPRAPRLAAAFARLTTMTSALRLAAAG